MVDNTRKEFKAKLKKHLTRFKRPKDVTLTEDEEVEMVDLALNELWPWLTEEEKARLYLSADQSSIARALRDAAGLPDLDNPFTERSDEAHLPYVGEFVELIWGHSPPHMGPNPRALEAEAEAVRSDINRLKKRLALLDREIVNFIRTRESSEGEELYLAAQTGNFDRILSAHKAWKAQPREQRILHAVFTELNRLEAVIVSLIEEAIEADAQLPKTGRIPNIHARNVAVVVAVYVEEVTGEIPGLTTSPMVTGPFALALTEIFKILGIKGGVQRPGEWAISELTSKLSKNSEL